MQHQPGSIISPKEYFGDFSRYAVYQVATRFGSEWVIADADSIDEETGLPSIIRQEATKEDVMKNVFV